MALQSLHRPVSSKDDVGVIVRFEVGLDVGLLLGVACSDGIGGSLCSFESVGHGQGDVLAPVTNGVIFERRPPLKAHAVETWRGGGAKDLADVLTMQNG